MDTNAPSGAVGRAFTKRRCLRGLLNGLQRKVGSWQELLTLPTRYAAVTNEQVKATAAKYFAPDPCSVVTQLPAPESEAAAA